LLLGCSTSPTTDEEFGQSVRQMVRSQKVHVAVDEAPVEGGDGQRLESVLDGYRDAAPAARESAPSSSIVINTGQ
jgi:hypothetical protein